MNGAELCGTLVLQNQRERARPVSCTCKILPLVFALHRFGLRGNIGAKVSPCRNPPTTPSLARTSVREKAAAAVGFYLIADEKKSFIYTRLLCCNAEAAFAKSVAVFVNKRNSTTPTTLSGLVHNSRKHLCIVQLKLTLIHSFLV